MRNILRALAFAALLPASALAQSAPATMPYHTVYGRLGATVGDTGPGQAIPFSVFNLQILNSLCQVNNAFPVYSSSTSSWGCSTAPSANTIFAGPSTGAAAQPTFRALVGADLPAPGASSLGGTQSKTCSTSNWFNAISTSGVPGCTQPAFSDLSGSATGAQLPNPSASTLGGVKSLVATSHQFLTSISTAGLPVAAQPAVGDISGFGTGVGTALANNTNATGGFPTYTAGTWTPALTTSGTVGAPTYAIQVGSYEQIGRQVTVRFNISTSGWTGSPTGNVAVTGLPLTSANTANDFGACHIVAYVVTGLAASNFGITASIAPNATTFTLQQGGTTTSNTITVAQYGTGATQIIGFCNYHT